MKTLSVQEMKAAEEAAVARGIGYLELMENAGSACTHALLEGHSVLNRRITILVGSGIAALVPEVADSLNNAGAHGFSEMLYAYSSAGGNNGSAFAGFNANTVFLNVSLGIVMLFVRFIPVIGTLAIAGSLAKKKKIATTAGTLSTCNAMFVFLLIMVVLLVGALSFFPALSLGPIAEHLGML